MHEKYTKLLLLYFGQFHFKKLANLIIIIKQQKCI